MKIDVLGTEYEVYKVDPYEKLHGQESLDEKCLGGYCDHDLKEIYVADMRKCKGWENERKIKIKERERGILRHEIVHAFLNESGLAWDSTTPTDAWAKNEEMVDWFAIQGEKIYKCWQNAEKLFFEKPVVIELNGKEIAKSVINEAEMLKNLKDKGMVEIG